MFFIIDTIGILTKIYSYAIAYVGGGFGILECTMY
jgi:3-deoxy-D-manno-octulosonic-acid transferase